MNARVYLTRPIPESGIKLLEQNCDLRRWQEETPVPRDILLREVAGVSGILSLLSDRIDEAVMEAAGPSLRVISNYAVGYDNIDLNAAKRRNVIVCNTPGILTETTADLAFALMLAAARRIPEGIDYVKADRWITWGPMLLLGQDVYGATLGIIGLGRIGAAVAERARGFKMRVLYFDGGGRSSYESDCGATMVPDLASLLKESDFISIHVPFMPQTNRMIGAEQFALMKKTAILINTARGQIIDPEALYAALSTGRITAAALDVTDPEPLRADHPLLKLPNCLVIPHLGSASVRTREKMSVIAAENLIAVLKGQQPSHPVTR